MSKDAEKRPLAGVESVDSGGWQQRIGCGGVSAIRREFDEAFAVDGDTDDLTLR